MAVLNMRYDGDEILRKKCKEVKEVDDRIRYDRYASCDA